MELRITPYQAPEAVVFNFEELRKEIESKCKMYESIAYTDDQIAEAKADKAQLNKLSKALNDARIAEEKKYMAPFDEFKSQVKSLCDMIGTAVGNIDSQVKAYDAARKQEKLAAIRAAFVYEGFPEFVTLEMVMDKTWENKSCSLSKIKGELGIINSIIMCELNTIGQFTDYRDEAMAEYKRTLSLVKAMEFRANLIRIRDETAAAAPAVKETIRAAEPPMEAPKVESCPAQWVAFEALITPEQGKLLRKFVDQNGIKIRTVQK